MKRLGPAAIILLLSMASPASAHPIPFSYLDLRLRPDGIDGTLVAHIYDVAHDLRIEPMERLLDPVGGLRTQRGDHPAAFPRARSLR